MINIILDFFQKFIINMAKLWEYLTTTITIPRGLGLPSISFTPLGLFASSSLLVILTLIIIKGAIS